MEGLHSVMAVTARCSSCSVMRLLWWLLMMTTSSVMIATPPQWIASRLCIVGTAVGLEPRLVGVVFVVIVVVVVVVFVFFVVFGLRRALAPR